MEDLLVNLYALSETIDTTALAANNIRIVQALAPDKEKIIAFVKKHFTTAWAAECEAAFYNNPVTCFIALQEKNIVGFACYEATAKNFFGPTGVDKKYGGLGIGTVLLKKSLLAMKELGYAYAIIGWGDGAAAFYQKAVGAQLIPGSDKHSVYTRLIEYSNENNL